jgi:hypothetical protein
MDAYVFEAQLVGFPDVSRRIAVRGDQTLADLHEELRRSLDWWEDGDAQITGTELACLGLTAGQELADLFDFGDEWRVRVRLAEIRRAGDETFPATLERRGKAPPQYPIPDDEELGAGD